METLRNSPAVGHKVGKRFECVQCGKQFKYIYNVVEHRRVHTGAKPFTCLKRGCSMRFKWRSSLTYHIAKCNPRETKMNTVEEEGSSQATTRYMPYVNSREVLEKMRTTDQSRSDERLLRRRISGDIRLGSESSIGIVKKIAFDGAQRPKKKSATAVSLNSRQQTCRRDDLNVFEASFGLAANLETDDLLDSADSNVPFCEEEPFIAMDECMDSYVSNLYSESLNDRRSLDECITTTHEEWSFQDLPDEFRWGPWSK